VKRALWSAAAVFLAAIIVAAAYLAANARPASQHAFFTSIGPTTEVIAHRGGAALRPENTMAAFDNAAKLGVDVLEMDVRLTADGELVVIHDATVDRTTEGNGLVAAMSLAQVQALDAGYRFGADSITFPFRRQDIRIPALKEVFAAHGPMRMVVEMKSYGEPTAAALCALIRTAGMTLKVLAASFDAATVQAFRRACPEVATAMTSIEARAFVIPAFAYLEGLTSPETPALIVPDRLRSLEVVTARTIGAAQSRALRMYVWTINEEARMRELLAMRIDGIMTDRPDRLLALRGSR
jgi:glycerophosphoryl diester phosphodiesterase